MTLLALDIGSSSVKAAVLRGQRLVGVVAREAFKTRYSTTTAEVDANAIQSAVARAIRSLGKAARSVDLIAPAVMAPSWVAMDRRGKAITPVVTHQDRRSIAIAKEIEAGVGKARHLRVAGNRPFPGGISSTTACWFVRNHPSVMKRADLVGHLSTLLHRVWTGARAIDPSNASFTGLYETTRMGTWSDELCSAAGIDKRWLPEIVPADRVVGKLTPDAARSMGLRAGTPLLAGLMDTSAAMLLAGANAGQVLNVAGTTDVLSICVDTARPHEKLLTRALGVDVNGEERWMSVATLASAGSSVEWARKQLFGELSDAKFYALLRRVHRETDADLKFTPYLGGDRTSIDQPTGSFTGMTLSTTREQMLASIVDAIARSSADRLALLRKVNRVTPLQTVMTSGGTASNLSETLYQYWKGKWNFASQSEATARGLAMLAERAKDFANGRRQ